MTTYIDGPAQLLMCIKGEFIDIGGHWAENHVLMLNQLDTVEGCPDSAFRPEEPVTKEQFAKMLVESGAIDVTQQSHLWDQLFGDADKVSDWARPCVKAATASGLIEGFEDDTFRPLNNVDRVRWQ